MAAQLLVPDHADYFAVGDWTAPASNLGWLHAVAVVQTTGLGWAFVIHAVQDVVIITLLIAVSRQQAAAQSARRRPAVK